MTSVHRERLGRADLHVHTTWSDGAQPPDAMVAAASGRVDVLAITDHDQIGGALVARDYARHQPRLGVDVVVGEEISTLNGPLLGLYLEERVPLPVSPRRAPSSSSANRAASRWLPIRSTPCAGRARGHPWRGGRARIARGPGPPTKLPRHVRYQSRGLIKFLRLNAQRRAL